MWASIITVSPAAKVLTVLDELVYIFHEEVLQLLTQSRYR